MPYISAIRIGDIMTINWQDVIDRYAADQQKPAVDFKDNEFSASSLTGCVRQAVKNKMLLQRHNKETLRMFQIGHMFHRFVQQNCSLGYINAPVEFEKRVIFDYDGIRIYGHVDAYDGNNVYDFKTAADLKMVKRFNPHMGYLYQLSTYLHALDAEKAYLVYLAKKDFEVYTKEVDIINKQTISKFCYEVIEACKIYKKTEQLPPLCKCFICNKERKAIELEAANNESEDNR